MSWWQLLTDIDVLLVFCKKNCESVGEAGCDACKVGYAEIPKCCQCAEDYTMNADGECGK